MELRDILFVTVLFTIAVTAIIGNALVILAVSLHRRLQTPANFLIVNLAVSDFLQGAISMPVRVAEVLNTTDKSLIRCDVVVAISIFFHGASNLNLALIAMDRFVAVSKPFSYAGFVKTLYYKLMIASAWMLIFVFASCPVLGWRRAEDDNESAGNICRFGTTLTREYMIILVVLVDLVPLVVMFITYTYIFRTTRKQIRQIRAQEVAVRNAAINLAFESRRDSHSNSEMSQNVPEVKNSRHFSAVNNNVPSDNNNQTTAHTSSSQSRITGTPSPGKKAPPSTVRSRKATRTVLAIIGFFFVLCLPISIIDTLELFCPSTSIPIWVTTVAIWMVSANSCVNVFVYGGYNTDYRRAYKNVWQKTKYRTTKHCCVSVRNSKPEVRPT